MRIFCPAIVTHFRIANRVHTWLDPKVSPCEHKVFAPLLICQSTACQSTALLNPRATLTLPLHKASGSGFNEAVFLLPAT